jgi:hypothetical protein
LGCSVLRNATKEDLKFINKTKKEVEGESSTFPMQSGTQTFLPSSSLAQKVHKIYTRYKYTTILEEKKENRNANNAK